MGCQWDIVGVHQYKDQISHRPIPCLFFFLFSVGRILYPTFTSCGFTWKKRNQSVLQLGVKRRWCPLAWCRWSGWWSGPRDSSGPPGFPRGSADRATGWGSQLTGPVLYMESVMNLEWLGYDMAPFSPFRSSKSSQELDVESLLDWRLALRPSSNKTRLTLAASLLAMLRLNGLI